jgi:hypothetical protein
VKYTQQQLQEMAAEFLGQLSGHNDVRCHQLIGRMAEQLNIHPNAVEQGIHMLAMGMTFSVQPQPA